MTTESVLFPQLNTYDWCEVFGYAGDAESTEAVGHGFKGIERAHTDETTNTANFSRCDVAEILAMSEGENDGPPWLIAGKLQDGRWFFIEAGCDYTGWDCQAGGTSIVASTKDDLIRYCITEESRTRLGLVTP